VALLSTGDDQSLGGWRRLEFALRDTLRDTAVPIQAHGFWMLITGSMMLAGLTFWVVDNPQTIAQGLERMLHP
jgi:hypothetical protein